MFAKLHDGDIYKFLYSGEWIFSVNRHTIIVNSACDDKALGSIQCVTKDEIDRCITSSKNALELWKNKPNEEIKNVLSLAAECIMSYHKQLSGLISLETCKKGLSAEEEVSRAYNLLSYISKNYEDLFDYKEVSFINQNPVGTILITPSSSLPLYSTTYKVIAALLSGNSILLSPPIKGTLSVLYISEIFNNSCKVKGLINTVTGILDPLLDYLITHKGIDFIDFIGDDGLGKHIAVSSKKIPLSIQSEEAYVNHSGGSLEDDISSIKENILCMIQKKLK